MGLSDFVIYALIFAVLIGYTVLKEYLSRQAAQRRPGLPGPQGVEQQPAPAPPQEVTDTQWGRAPAPERAMPRAKPDAWRTAHGSAQPRDRGASPQRARHPLFRNRQQLRHAIVVMTVLGPCRAQQPYDDERH